MQEEDCESLAKKLHESFGSMDSAAQKQLIDKIDLSISGYMLCSDACFDVLVDIIGNKNTAQDEESSALIKLFEYNIDILTDRQKRKLYQKFESAFSNYIDPAALILMVELLVDGNKKNDALIILKRLKHNTETNARAILPYGFQYLCKKSKDRKITEQAIREVQALSKDSQVEVQQESENALIYINRIVDKF